MGEITEAIKQYNDKVIDFETLRNLLNGFDFQEPESFDHETGENYDVEPWQENTWGEVEGAYRFDELSPEDYKVLHADAWKRFGDKDPDLEPDKSESGQPDEADDPPDLEFADSAADKGTPPVTDKPAVPPQSATPVKPRQLRTPPQ